MTIGLSRQLGWSVIAALWGMAQLAVAGPAADLRTEGPLALVITYHTTPDNRLALRRQLETVELRQFEHWKAERTVQNYRVLFSRHVDSGTWDAAALLTFPDHSAVERWKEVEQVAPAGLSKRALRLTSAIETAPADLVRSSDPVEPVKTPVFMVVPYEVFVPTDEYLSYLDGYVIPQLKGWIDAGVLAGYGVYLPRYYAGRPWASLLVLEYRSDEALGMREAIIGKVRARLKEDPQWQAMSEDKKKIREEKAAVIADPLTRR